MRKESCQLCLEVCPYDAPQFGVEENAKIQKCDLHLEGRLMGKKSVCVTGCLTMALDAGPLDKIQAEYGEAKEAVGFIFDAAL